jgi:hypothetical protein
MALMAMSIRTEAQDTVSDVVGKVIVGYQGWFDCAGSGSPINKWNHWAGGSAPSPGIQSFEIWPDTREYTSLYQSGYANLGNGQPAKLFASWNDQTIDKHFEWMQTYGIDGAALQRFGSELSGSSLTWRNQVATKMSTAAQKYGKKFYIMWDISGWNSFATAIETDWTNTIVGSLKLTSSPAYARQNGKFVVCIWGMGFTDRPGDTTQCISVINWFKSQGCYVIGGVPTNWRNSNSDSKPGFLGVYKQFDMIQPWMAGRMSDIAGADNIAQNILSPDFTYCKANGIDYSPCMFPGFAWSNWNGGSKNMIPRIHGDFMWRQAYNMRNLGIPSAYVGMWDEYDEGTAIIKAAEDASMIPTNQYFLTLDADGVRCSSDFYLRLTGDITKLIKGQIALTTAHPTVHYPTSSVRDRLPQTFQDVKIDIRNGILSFTLSAGKRVEASLCRVNGESIATFECVSSGAAMRVPLWAQKRIPNGMYVARVNVGSRELFTIPVALMR